MEAAQETFEFPRDITLDEARQAIKGCFEFKEKEENGLIFIDYRFSSKNTFPDPNSTPDPVKKRLLAIRRYVHDHIIFLCCSYYQYSENVEASYFQQLQDGLLLEGFI